MKTIRVCSMILAFLLLPPMALAGTARRAREARHAPFATLARGAEQRLHEGLRGNGSASVRHRRGHLPHFRHSRHHRGIRRRFSRGRDHERHYHGLFISFTYHHPPFHLSYGYPCHSYSRRSVVRSYVYTEYPTATYSYYGSDPVLYPTGSPNRTGLVIVDSPTTRTEPGSQQQISEQPAPPRTGTYDSQFSAGLAGPAEAGFAFAVGELRLVRGDYPGAAESFREAVSEAPDRPAAGLALALALTGSGDYASAGRVLRRSLRAIPDWNALYIESDTVFGTPERFAAVLERLDERLRAEPTNDDLHLLSGFLRFAAGRTEAALEVLQGAGQAGGIDAVLDGLRWEVRRSVERVEAVDEAREGAEAAH